MNILGNVYYSLLYDLTRNRWISESKKSIFQGIVLMFHHVTDENIDANDSCKCTIDAFKTIIEIYKNKGYTFVSLDEAINIIKNKEPKKFVVVTFDDIPDSVFVNAYPILKEQRIPFTVFIAAGFINQDSYITMEHLLELNCDSLCSIGAHTMTHPMLKRISNIKIKWEIEQSKIMLEQITGKPIRFFAYPYGRYSSVSKKVINIVRDVGYDCAFCTISAPLSEASSENLYFLPRVVPTLGETCVFNKEWNYIMVIKEAFKALSKRLSSIQ